MARIKAIIWDFDGVLMRTEDDGPRHAWDQRLGLPIGSVERAVQRSDIWVQAQLGRVTEKAYWLGVAELLYIRRDNLDLIRELRTDFFAGDRLNYRLISLIQELKTAGYHQGLLTNNSLQLEAKLRDLGIYDLFDCVLISAQIGFMKPDSAAYRVALQELHVKPDEAVVIDDALNNIRVAQTMGIPTILYRPETDVRAELELLLNTGSEA
ncbi:MAG TPA: HAD family phosphatase [Aggregatilineaceae bacterium]|nr:HAD family phosphatase [Aggregatilineaceae bacterium]